MRFVQGPKSAKCLSTDKPYLLRPLHAFLSTRTVAGIFQVNILYETSHEVGNVFLFASLSIKLNIPFALGPALGSVPAFAHFICQQHRERDCCHSRFTDGQLRPGVGEGHGQDRTACRWQRQNLSLRGASLSEELILSSRGRADTLTASPKAVLKIGLSRMRFSVSSCSF